MTKGLFITVEGPEGAGKTTVIQMIAEELKEEGIQCILTREPGGIPIAEKIRNLILDKSHTEMDAKTEALLYAASRRQHLVEKVEPALLDGAIVLCDRFIDASLAYQGYARKIGVEEVYSINQFAIGDVMPDMTLYFDIDPKEGLKRIQRNRSAEVNRLDLEDIQFHYLVREGYLKLVDKFPNRMVKVNASKPIEAVKQEAKRLIVNKIKQHFE